MCDLHRNRFRHVADEPDEEWEQLTFFRRMSLSVMNAFGLSPTGNKMASSVTIFTSDGGNESFVN
jgi:hypothetical protein